MKNGLIIDPYGTKRWYLNDKYYREDGPSIEYSDGAKEWWVNGKWHREDGPAIEYSDGYNLWYLNDIRYSEKNYYKELYKRGLIDEKQLMVELL